MKKTKLNNYLIGLFENRPVYMGGVEAVFSAGDSEGPEGEPEKDDAESVDTESTEKKESVQSGPTPTAEQAKRNMTRSHAARISKRLGQLSGDEKAASLANAIDTAYEKSVEAENSHDATSIESATQYLRSALLSGRAHLDTTGHTERTGADRYAERELGLDEEQREALAARQELAKRSQEVKKKIYDLKKKYKDLTEEQLSNIKKQLDPIYRDVMDLVNKGEFEAAKIKFDQYEKIAIDKFRKAANETQEKKLTPKEYESVGMLAGATIETEEEMETVNVAKIMGGLQSKLASAIKDYGAGIVDSFGHFNVEANVYNALAAAFTQLSESEKKAIGGASIRYVTTNPKARDEAWIITATFNRSGDVSIDRTIQKREKNTELSDQERTEMGKFKNGELYTLIEASEAREKTPEEVNKLLKNAIDSAVKNWAENGTADDRVLKQWIEKAIDQVRNSLTKEEWKAAEINTGLLRVPGTTFDWDYQVTISDGNVTVVTD